MTRDATPFLLAASIVAAPAAAQQDVHVFVKEEALNRLVDRLRDPSDSGLYQPLIPLTQPTLYYDCQFAGFLPCFPPLGPPEDPFATVPLVRCRKEGGGTAMAPAGAPIAWQWWITGSRFRVSAGRLEFTAKVRSRIGTRWSSVERTVPATISFDDTTNLLRVQVGEFKVGLKHEADGIIHDVLSVDVGKLSSFTIRVPPQTGQVRLPDGTTRTLSARARRIVPRYEPGRIALEVDVDAGPNQTPPGGWTVGAPGAEDGRVGIHESLLNEVATAIGSLSFQGSLTIPIPVPNPFFPIGPLFFIINSTCGVTVNVTNVRFDMNAAPDPIRVSGQVNGTICNVPLIGGTVNTTATVVHDETAGTLRIDTAPTTLRPSAGGFTAPFTVNVGPAFSLPAIPFRATVLEIVTSSGPMPFLLSSDDVELTRRNNFIEVRGNVSLR